MTPTLQALSAQLRENLREIPDYPKPGILFYDITTILENASCLHNIISFWHERYKDEHITHVVGIESRGFIFGAALAYALGVGLVPVRKKGKLPYKTFSQDYALEYGTDTLEIHQDAFASTLAKGKKPRVVLVDDLLATGGTARASVELIKQAGGECIEACFLIRLLELHGEKNLTTNFIAILDC